MTCRMKTCISDLVQHNLPVKRLHCIVEAVKNTGYDRYARTSYMLSISLTYAKPFCSNDHAEVCVCVYMHGLDTKHTLQRELSESRTSSAGETVQVRSAKPH